MWLVRYRDFGDGFRADTGFVPRVGYREGSATAGWNFYSEGLVTQARPHVVLTYSEDRDGRRAAAPGRAGRARPRAPQPAGVRRPCASATERTGDGGCSRRPASSSPAQVDPSRTFTRVGVQGSVGEAVDLVNVQVGTGADLSAFATVRP